MTGDLPVHKSRSGGSVRSHKAKANRGLLFNKFFDGWATADRGKGYAKSADQTGKSSFLKTFAGDVSCGEAAAYARRVERLAEANGGRSAAFTSTAPLVVGIGLPHPVENGFLWHHTLGVPYLPGSGIKGLMRHWVSDWLALSDGNDRDETARLVTRLFGSDDAQNPAIGSIIVFDALPLEDVTLMVEVVTPHDGGWRIRENVVPADWVSPVPIPFLAVAPGATFQFSLAPRGRAATADDVDCAFELLTDALAWLGAGAKTASGFGRFDPVAGPLEVGDRVMWSSVPKPLVIVEIDGDRARVRVADDPSARVYRRKLSELVRA